MKCFGLNPFFFSMILSIPMTNIVSNFKYLVFILSVIQFTAAAFQSSAQGYWGVYTPGVAGGYRYPTLSVS
jgi:hypothetical protein